MGLDEMQSPGRFLKRTGLARKTEEKHMGFVISVQQDKGGVGKTTVATTLAESLARADFRTLLVDFDPAADASRLLASNLPSERPQLQALLKAGQLAQGVLVTRTGGLFVVPGDRTVKPQNFQDEELVQLLLDQALESVHSDFDFVVVDVKGGLDLMGQMAMYASDLVVIPVDRDSQTVRLAHLTFKYAVGVAKKRERVGRPVRDGRTFAKYLLSKWDERKRASKRLQEGLAALPEHAIFQTRLSLFEDFQGSRNEDQTFFDFAESLVPSSKKRDSYVKAMKEIESLTREVIEHAENLESNAQCANA